jgi:hypothetical protein
MKEELIQKLEDLIKEEIGEDVFLKADEIKNAFVEACRQDEHDQHEKMLVEEHPSDDQEPQKDPLDSRFNELIHILDDREKKFKKLRRDEVREKLEAKKAVVAELQQLIGAEANIGKAFSDFKTLQQRWNDIGNVPLNTYKHLQAEYHRHVHNFYYNMKLSKDLRDLDFKRNLEFRQQLLGKIESLLALDSVKGMERMLGLYRMEWSELGPTAAEKTDELRTRYRELISQALQKIRGHYKERKDYEQHNLEIKAGLLEALRALVAGDHSTPKHWQKAGEEMRRLVNEWKQTGMVPKADNQRIWEEFRAEMNTFQSRRRSYFGDLKKDYREHKEKKQALIRQAEELAAATHTDWQEPTRAVISLQKQWKEAGHMDARDEHRLWKKFREACDKFFAARQAFFSEMDRALEGNLKKKEELISRLEAFAPTGNAEEDIKTLRNFSKEWKDIPHVPFKEKQRIYDQYKKALDRQYDALKLEASQLHLLKFRTNVELLSHSDDSDHLLRKEKGLLQDRVKKLQSTISQYENNLGFFTNAKNMGGLLAEVEGNLTKARAELDLLKQKLKVFSELR